MFEQEVHNQVHNVQYILPRFVRNPRGACDVDLWLVRLRWLELTFCYVSAVHEVPMVQYTCSQQSARRSCDRNSRDFYSVRARQGVSVELARLLTGHLELGKMLLLFNSVAICARIAIIAGCSLSRLQSTQVVDLIRNLATNENILNCSTLLIK